MPIETRSEAGAAVIAISGRLVLGNDLEPLETAVNQAISEGRQCIVLDLSALDYLDSSGVGTIVACLTNAKKAGGDLKIAGSSTRVTRILHLTGVDALVSMHPTVAAATGGA